MKKKETIVIDNKIPFIQGILEPYADIRYLSPQEITPDAVHDADMLITAICTCVGFRTRTRCNADLLEGSRCRFIGTATIGFDHIDTEYCRRHAIEWVNAPGCNAASVAQYITASLLRHAEKQAIDLRTKRIGIVGVGHVGRQVEIHCRRLGMQVLLNDPPRAEKEGLHHVPYTADKRRLVCDLPLGRPSFLRPIAALSRHSQRRAGRCRRRASPFWRLIVITL